MIPMVFLEPKRISLISPSPLSVAGFHWQYEMKKPD